MLNKSKGNMYAFITHTKNYLKGKCPHNCPYCYMKQFNLQPMRFDTKELNENMGKNKFIFVGSSCDPFANDVNSDWIKQILSHCNQYPLNKYLFQSKNPERFQEFIGLYPPNTTLGTTIETNRHYPLMLADAPPMNNRIVGMKAISNIFDTMVTIEPIMDFDTPELINIIKAINPQWVNIGADSKGHKLPEPNAEKIKDLLWNLHDVTDVKIKPNLTRIYNAKTYYHLQ